MVRLGAQRSFPQCLLEVGSRHWTATAPEAESAVLDSLCAPLASKVETVFGGSSEAAEVGHPQVERAGVVDHTNLLLWRAQRE